MPLREGSRIAISQVRCVVGELCLSYVSIGFLTFSGFPHRACQARYWRVDSRLASEVVRSAVERQSKHQQHRNRASPSPCSVLSIPRLTDAHIGVSF